jgi:hypothetical protein
MVKMPMRLIFGATWLAAAVVLAVVGTARAESPTAEGLEFFESKVRPLFVEKCGKCHTAKKAAESGELVLDSPAGIERGGSRGTLFAPGKPTESLLLKAIGYADAELQMPPDGKLPASAVAVLAKWIEMGAPLPAADDTVLAPQKSIDIAAGRTFWSFQPLTAPTLPSIQNPKSKIQNQIDAWIISRLDHEGLAPSPAADRRTLIRRVTFDLIGLPPTPDEVDAFAADDRPDAYERLVDRLLSSPHYGERWGRYWLDLARYADENPSWLSSAKLGYRYRNWVVAALNADVPYDRFVKLQLAADLDPGVPPADMAALGFLGLSPTYWKELRLAPQLIEVIVADEWDEKIDAVSRTVLGLSVACARCHDHKFDPITTRDYYALAGVFANTQQVDRPVLPPDLAESVRLAKEQITKLEAELAPIKDKDKQKAVELSAQIERLQKETPHYGCEWIHGVEDSRVEVLPDGPDKTRLVYHRDKMDDLPVYKRGNPANRGEIVPRRFLEVLSPAAPERFDEGSGRRELAEALFTSAQPLTARVIANRIWAHHFGVGLVRTTSDFGRQGEPPTHPELLDHLATRLVSGGWSLKRLQREMVGSATYRQTSQILDFGLPILDSNSDNPKSAIQNPKLIDPSNRLLWRMNRRRLDVEAWRDSLLAASGELDLTIGGRPSDLSQPSNCRRTLYAKIGREDQDNLLLLYDFPTPTGHSPSRELTTTPLQQLYVLNSPLFAARAKALAQRIGPPAAVSDSDRQVTSLYRELLARVPSERELALAREFLAAGTWDDYVHAVLGSNEVMFVD